MKPQPQSGGANVIPRYGANVTDNGRNVAVRDKLVTERKTNQVSAGPLFNVFNNALYPALTTATDHHFQ